MEEDIIKSAFPNLAIDSDFKITSKVNYNYNCIEYALVDDKVVLWPSNLALDGTKWPKHLPRNDDIDTFIELFKFHGHEICPTADYENGYRKIALFVKDGRKCTHAARQKQDGLWYSKLGPQHDISHSTPQSLEGDQYGTVYCIMRKSLK